MRILAPAVHRGLSPHPLDTRRDNPVDMGSRSRRGVRRSVQPVIRARSIGDLLGVLPVLFGFHPERSLVVASLHGPRQRLGFSMRLDLPPPEHIDMVACQVADLLRRYDTRAALVVAYAGDDSVADPLVEACVDRLTLDGVEVVEALRCDGSRYWSYRCTDPVCCPPTGTPYDVSASQGLAQAVLAGVEVLPDRAAVAARLAPVTGAVRSRMELATSAAAADLQAEGRGLVGTERARRQAGVGAKRVKPVLARATADPGAPLSDADVALLSVWCSLIVVRDVAWAQLSRDNADAAFAVWAQVARRVVPPFEPAVLSLAGFAAWLKGDGASASCAVERVAAADPDYSMMLLLRETLARGIPPTDWPQLNEQEVWASLDG